MCYVVTSCFDLIACTRSTIGNVCILSRFFSIIFTSHKFSLCSGSCILLDVFVFIQYRTFMSQIPQPASNLTTMLVVHLQPDLLNLLFVFLLYYCYYSTVAAATTTTTTIPTLFTYVQSSPASLKCRAGQGSTKLSLTLGDTVTSETWVISWQWPWPCHRSCYLPTQYTTRRDTRQLSDNFSPECKDFAKYVSESWRSILNANLHQRPRLSLSCRAGGESSSSTVHPGRSRINFSPYAESLCIPFSSRLCAQHHLRLCLSIILDYVYQQVDVLCNREDTFGCIWFVSVYI